MFSKIMMTIELEKIFNATWLAFFLAFACIGFGVVILNALRGFFGSETSAIVFNTPSRNDSSLALVFFVCWFGWSVRIVWLKWCKRHDE